LTDSTGNQVATYSYDPYGTPSATTGTLLNPLRFAGQYTDAETGFLYLRARYYDPATGQFLSRDPIESVTGEPYSYASNDPINGSDPTGFASGSGGRELSTAEKVFCYVNGVSTCAKVGAVLKLAQSLTQDYMDVGPNNIATRFTQQDAFYHTVGAALLTDSTLALGPRLANEALRAHEAVVLDNPHASALDRQDTCNDLRNNAVGMRIGLALRAEGERGLRDALSQSVYTRVSADVWLWIEAGGGYFSRRG
ncbi:MAG: RHS repeat-associated core domain-containing protein, partial [Micromonosporaceae bacterium]